MNTVPIQQRSIYFTTREALIPLLGSILLTDSAKIVVPFYPVPMSTQTVIVLGLGLFLGPIRGSLVVFVYLLEGIFGLPVFAGTPPAPAGLAYVFGPTGGFLAGFLLAAAVTGWMVRKIDGFPLVLTAALAVVAGSVVLYIPGLIWLGNFVGYEKKLLEVGLYPFILGDAMKAAIAITLYVIVRGRRSI